MANDDAVYLAKLAEQAERYEGMLRRLCKTKLTLPMFARVANMCCALQRWSRT